jgi:hypothetical protein
MQDGPGGHDRGGQIRVVRAPKASARNTRSADNSATGNGRDWQRYVIRAGCGLDRNRVEDLAADEGEACAISPGCVGALNFVVMVVALVRGGRVFGERACGLAAGDEEEEWFRPNCPVFRWSLLGNDGIIHACPDFPIA